MLVVVPDFVDFFPIKKVLFRFVDDNDEEFDDEDDVDNEDLNLISRADDDNNGEDGWEAVEA